MKAINLLLAVLVLCGACEKKSQPAVVLGSLPTSKQLIDFSIHSQPLPSADEFAKLAKSHKEFMVELLAPEVDPYTGPLPSDPRCLVENLPDSSEFKHGICNYLYAEKKSKLLGRCGTNKELIKVSHCLVFCEKQQKLFRIKAFYPSETPWPKHQSAQCQ